MKRSEAHEHLAMVDRILERAENRPFRPVPALLIIWGFAGAAIDAGSQAFLATGVTAYAYAGEISIVVAILLSIVVAVAIVRSADSLPATERRMGRAIAAVWVCIVCAAFSEPHVFAGWAAGGIWTVGAAISMFISGFSGDRRATAGGIILLASLLVANYLTPNYPGYALAAGMVLGYAVPGIVLALQSMECEE